MKLPHRIGQIVVNDDGDDRAGTTGYVLPRNAKIRATDFVTAKSNPLQQGWMKLSDAETQGYAGKSVADVCKHFWTAIRPANTDPLIVAMRKARKKRK